jgi:hypothetical protein
VDSRTVKYSRIYPGESRAKCIARMQVYQLATGAPRWAHAITLAGPTPEAELTLMRDYLGWCGDRAWLIDWAKDPLSREATLEALQWCKTEWDAANVCHIDLQKLLPYIGPIGFANFDFMGGMSRNNVQPCLKLTIPRLAVGGVIALTWFRGREQIGLSDRSAHDVWRAGEGAGDGGIADRRTAGVLRIVEQMARAEGVKLDLTGSIEYQHQRSPMSVSVWQRVG